MKSQNIKILNWSIFKDLPISTGITTRINGFSSFPYSSFNLALHTGDSKISVNSNRKKLCDSLNIPLESYTHGVQVHGDNIHFVTKYNIGENSVNCDGLITTTQNAMLNIYVADCVPIVVYDRSKNIGGLCHCGWKGTEKQLLGKMINEFQNKYNSKVKDILIGIGPSIGKCCYNVSEDLYRKFNPHNIEGKIDGNNYFLDLKEINRNQSLHLGIPKENIEIMDLCTSCNNDLFYSHRKEGEPSGRFSCFLKITK